MKLTAAMVRKSQSDDDPWRVGNQLLYDFCRQHPRHVVDAEIVAKVWLIGRAYSASLERGRGDVGGTDVTNDGFYTEHVTRVLRNFSLDKKLKALQKVKGIDDSSIGDVLDAHQVQSHAHPSAASPTRD